MRQCWEPDPDTRPSFSHLVNSLSVYLESVAGYMEVNSVQ